MEVVVAVILVGRYCNVDCINVLVNSMSVGLQNSISVNMAMGMSIVSNNTITASNLQKDCDGNRQVVYDDASNYMLARKLWLANINTLKRCEENYELYVLYDDSMFLNRKVLYYTQDSCINVNKNIIELMKIHNRCAI